MEQIHESPEVFLCRGYRNEDRAPVTLKLLKEEIQSPRAVARLRHEYAILRDLDIRGVVKSYGLVEHGQSCALVLEDPGGEPLHHVLRRERLELRTALELASSLADTLAALHARKVIHKDLKPHNVLVSLSTRTTKLIDFGISTRLSRETQSARNPEALEGTLAYMSPEQTGRTNRLLDQRSDLYSFGVMFYEMLTGSLPFPTTDALELVHSHIARKPTPPHEVVPKLPRVVSDITMRLLAKAVEDRYQSARGLHADLVECLARLSPTGTIAPFPIAQHDRVGVLHLPQRLFGREESLSTLEAAWRETISGTAGVALVRGPSGVGKSSLVAELSQAVQRAGGVLVAGKFDQLGSSTPYAPIAYALRELVRRVLAEPPATLARWREALRAALGKNGRILTDRIPELELIIGPQEPVAALGPVEAQVRFQLLFQSFLRLFTTRSRPLALFLDDLQWADAESLRLVEMMLSEPSGRHLLLIGAYRDREVDADHPLNASLAALRRAGTRFVEITLQPLDERRVGQLVGEALSCDPTTVTSLVEVVWKRTEGNPFFVHRFLEALHEQNLLTFDPRRGTWSCDAQHLQDTIIVESVVALMAQKIQRLSPTSQQALKLAACVGHEFDLHTLSVVYQRPVAETVADLGEALCEGLIVPLGDDYSLVDASRAGPSSRVVPTGVDVSYRFLHDRVQQAAYMMVPEGEKQQVHLSIGRLLLAASEGEPSQEGLFKIAEHLNRGLAHVTDPADRVMVARVNLDAGRRAKAAIVHQTATGYLRAGIGLLDEARWEDEYELCYGLHAELAECGFLAGAQTEAEAACEAAIEHARSITDKAQLYSLRTVLYTTVGKYEEALTAGWTALSLFGVARPEGMAALGAEVQGELIQVQALLSRRPIASLLDAPELTDPDRRLEMQILVDLMGASFFVDQLQFTLVVAKMVSLSLRHGQMDLSAFAYMLYAVVLGATGMLREAYGFGKLGIELCARWNSPRIEAKVLSSATTTTLTLFEPLQLSLVRSARGLQVALEAGDILSYSYSAYMMVFNRAAMGEALGAYRAGLADVQAFLVRVKNGPGADVVGLGRQFAACLMGETKGRMSLSNDTFDEDALVATLDKPDAAVTAGWYHTLKVQLAVLYGDHELALAHAATAESLSAKATGCFFITELLFHANLARAALARGGADVEALTGARAQLATWAECCPDTFLHKRLLVDALVARASGDELSAIDLFDQAVEAACKSGFVHHQALASELLAQLHLERGRKHAAQVHLAAAHSAYLQWGATAKAQQLTERYGPSFAPWAGAPRPSSEAPATQGRLSTSITITTTGDIRGTTLDMLTVFRAAQAIAGEIELERVLERILRIVVENTGAELGHLFLPHEDALVLRTSMTVQADAVVQRASVPLEATTDVPRSVVYYAVRTLEAVVLGDALKDARFAADPHISATQPRSILCLPLLHQGKLSGVLHLAHHAATDVFTPARIELCQVLCAQAAIAVENALLVGRVQASTVALQRLNSALETEIGQRTEELRASNAQLVLELREREHAERERTRLQEEIIRAQGERLSEMSTPLIPITDRIMVMPLIGTLDRARVRQVLEAALEGAQARAASVVILDITGVRDVDTEVANSLLKTAAALRLLGAQVVLTGMRPEVARTVVSLNIDLRGIVIRGTLQSAILHAIRLSGEAAQVRRVLA
ncbi:protein kinase domain-containing protein [Chondromyces crocatus]|uniref:protein kinase domain-containing protein n=1 Tax=Chondromyces crocatus TaxID=52 RepID=UPI00147001E6|nr:AAA family ATPase [Chondromyces crocatus]